LAKLIAEVVGFKGRFVFDASRTGVSEVYNWFEIHYKRETSQ